MEVHFDRAVVGLGAICEDDCGNGVIDEGEICDGANVGTESCVSQGEDGGTLVCNATCDGFDDGACFTCTDGEVNGLEECEIGIPFATFDCSTIVGGGFDGGQVTACRPNCRYDTSPCTACGNGILEAGEICDGNSLNGQSCATQGAGDGVLACNPDCQGFDTSACFRCGDGNIDAGEFCDPGPAENLGGATCENLGFVGGTLSCKANCNFDTSLCDPGQQVTEVCGNGVREGTEQCDDNSSIDPTDDDLGGDDCISRGFDGGQLSCNSNCTFNVTGCYDCGDGTTDTALGEECDPNDGTLSVPCSDIVPGSNGTLTNAECNLNCTWNTATCTVCGNGILEIGEVCDNAGTSDPADDALGGETCITQGQDGGDLACNGTCDGFDTDLCTRCGDGNVDTQDGEECDPNAVITETCDTILGGGSTGTLGCGLDCQWDTSQCTGCGNGVLEAPENCDGNALGGFACSDFSNNALPLSSGPLLCDNSCAFDLSNCCGDGSVGSVEECDNNNTLGDNTDDLFNNGSLTCEDFGFVGNSTAVSTCNSNCQVDLSVCSNCGNGSLDPGEQCDHNGTPDDNGDGLDIFAALTCIDLGFDGGTFVGDSNDTCDASCRIQTPDCTRCGNGVKEGSESCDGNDTGGATCETEGLGTGDLACTPLCQLDSSTCVECVDCRDCNNQACNDGQCGACQVDADCCSGLQCVRGSCRLL